MQDRFADKGLTVVAVAVDAQGPAAALPWYRKQPLTYPQLIDASNALGRTIGYRAVPNQFYVDELGVFHGNLDEPALARKLAEPMQPVPDDLAARLRATFDRGPDESATAQAAAYLAAGNKSAAAEALRQALKSDPKNWLIRKQIWAIEHPDKFYLGSVDFQWQRAQLAKERTAKQ